jgi:hypothetical protein
MRTKFRFRNGLDDRLANYDRVGDAPTQSLLPDVSLSVGKVLFRMEFWRDYGRPAHPAQTGAARSMIMAA